MVTHDAYAASYATRIIFIKDGKIYNEIRKGNDTRKEFFDKIIDNNRCRNLTRRRHK